MSAKYDPILGKLREQDTGIQGDPGVGVPIGGTTGQVLAKNSNTNYDTGWIDQTTGGGAVDSVNTQTGTVVLDADDIDDTSTTNKFVTSADITKLANLSGTNTGDQTIPVTSVATRTGDIVLTESDISTGGNPGDLLVVSADNTIAQTSAITIDQITGDVDIGASLTTTGVDVAEGGYKISGVALSASDVGAEPAGTAAGAVTTHETTYDHTLLHAPGSDDQDLSGLVPYTGATSAVNLGSQKLEVATIEDATINGELTFQTKANPSGNAGNMYFFPGNGTSQGGSFTMQGGNATSTGYGGNITIQAGVSAGATDGASVFIDAGDAGTSGTGGQATLSAGRGGSTSGNGGKALVTGGDARTGTNGNGGDVELAPGKKNGSGTDGKVRIVNGANLDAILDASNIASTDKTFTFPNASGTLALTTDAPAAHTQAESTITFTDITTGNVSASAHGYAPKLPNNTTTYLRGDGTWATVSASGDGLGTDGDKGDITVGGSGTTLTIDAGAVTEAKMTLADNTTNDVSTTKHGFVPKAPNNTTTWLRGDATWAASTGYSIQVAATNQATTTDGQTVYWGGNFALAQQTTADICRVYIPRAGTIKAAYIHVHSGTAGSNENWTMNIRKNNTTDTAIQTLAANTANRVWSNTGLSITVAAGDYIEIKEVQPTWGTNPANCRRSGVIYIE